MLLTNWLHKGKAGDVILSLALVKAMGGGNLFLGPFNHARALLPLLRWQDYLGSVELHEGQPVDCCLDAFRDLPEGDYKRMNLLKAYQYAFPAPVDFSQPWFSVVPIKTNMVIVNRTLTNRNPWISYGCLKPCEVMFIGLPEEYSDFALSNFQCCFHECRDFLEVARLIAGGRCFIGNSSCCWAIAEGLKVPRILEVNPTFPNCCSFGAGGWDCYTSAGFRSAVRQVALSPSP